MAKPLNSSGNMLADTLPKGPVAMPSEANDSPAPRPPGPNAHHVFPSMTSEADRLHPAHRR